jgi:DNA-directed RNA polymerase specialized sigma24 family protein
MFGFEACSNELFFHRHGLRQPSKVFNNFLLPERSMPDHPLAIFGNNIRYTGIKLLGINAVEDYDKKLFATLKDHPPEEIFKAALSGLSFREREILKLRYGVETGYSYTLQEVGQIFNLTRERIRQLESVALRKMALRIYNTSSIMS